MPSAQILAAKTKVHLEDHDRGQSIVQDPDQGEDPDLDRDEEAQIEGTGILESTTPRKEVLGEIEREAGTGTVIGREAEIETVIGREAEIETVIEREAETENVKRAKKGCERVNAKKIKKLRKTKVKKEKSIEERS
jgi:hypothetical protein